MLFGGVHNDENQGPNIWLFFLFAVPWMWLWMWMWMWMWMSIQTRSRQMENKMNKKANRGCGNMNEHWKLDLLNQGCVNLAQYCKHANSKHTWLRLGKQSRIQYRRRWRSRRHRCRWCRRRILVCWWHMCCLLCMRLALRILFCLRTHVSLSIYIIYSEQSCDAFALRNFRSECNIPIW